MLQWQEDGEEEDMLEHQIGLAGERDAHVRPNQPERVPAGAAMLPGSTGVHPRDDHRTERLVTELARFAGRPVERLQWLHEAELNGSAEESSGQDAAEEGQYADWSFRSDQRPVEPGHTRAAQTDQAMGEADLSWRKFWNKFVMNEICNEFGTDL